MVSGHAHNAGHYPRVQPKTRLFCEHVRRPESYLPFVESLRDQGSTGYHPETRYHLLNAEGKMTPSTNHSANSMTIAAVLGGVGGLLVIIGIVVARKQTRTEVLAVTDGSAIEL